MNWSDLLVIAIIGGFVILGMMNGFIMSIFRLASFFISTILAVKCYPVVAGILMKSTIYISIKSSIAKNLILQQQAQAPQINEQAKSMAADAMVNQLKLPGFMKGVIKGQIPNPTDILPMDRIVDMVSDQLAKLAVDIISLLVIFILVRVGMVFLKFVLAGVAKLPIFRQMDKLGGIAFGAVEGLLMVYIVFAVAMLLNSMQQFEGFFKAVDSSLIAKFFYQHNFIIDWMFPKG